MKHIPFSWDWNPSTAKKRSTARSVSSMPIGIFCAVSISFCVTNSAEPSCSSIFCPLFWQNNKHRMILLRLSLHERMVHWSHSMQPQNLEMTFKMLQKQTVQMFPWIHHSTMLHIVGDENQFHQLTFNRFRIESVAEWKNCANNCQWMGFQW